MNTFLQTLVLAVAAGCLLPSLAGAGEGGPELTVLAAATLQAPLKELAAGFDGGRTRVRFSFDSSGVLSRQIRHGAPADLFIAADQPWIDGLKAAGLLLDGTIGVIAGSSLVVIQPVGTPPVKDLGGVAALHRVAIGDPATVPAGVYAREALQGAGIWDVMRERLVYAGNGAAVAALVERGEVDAGIVMNGTPWRRDLAVAAYTIPEALHHPIAYPAAVLAASEKPALARAFLLYLRTPEARAVLAQHGFTLPAGAPVLPFGGNGGEGRPVPLPSGMTPPAAGTVK